MADKIVIRVSRHQATNESQIIQKNNNNDLKNNIRQQKSLIAILKYDQNQEPVALQVQDFKLVFFYKSIPCVPVTHLCFSVIQTSHMSTFYISQMFRPW